MDKLDMKSVNIISENIEKIKELFPNAVTETEEGLKINYDMLKQELSNDIVEGNKEKYQLTWPGKKEAILTANTPINKTLRPVKEKSVNFDSTQNIYIEGDNLETLKILQESYLNKIKCIYIDPPYNTGNDFIYNDNFNKDANIELEESGQIDEEGNRLIINNQSNGRFHSDWISMMYSRLKLAKNLLAKDGVIFISIDDNEVDNLKKICDEIFGENNFVSNIIWQSTIGSNTGSNTITTVTENILTYSKTSQVIINKEQFINDGKMKNKDAFFERRGYYTLDKLDSIRQSSHYSVALNYAIMFPDGVERYPGGFSEPRDGWNYLWSKSKVEWGCKNGFIEFKKNKGIWGIYNKRYEKVDNNDNQIERGTIFRNFIPSAYATTSAGNKDLQELFNSNLFDYNKPAKLIRKLLELGTKKDSIVLDFFSGSATTAHAVMQLNVADEGNRRFIMVQIPEKTDEKSEAYKNGYNNICEIGEERIRRAAKKLKEETNADIDYGFRVYKVDSSNMRDVYYEPSKLGQEQLNMFESNIKEDRTSEDLLTQVMLDLGLTLDLSIEEKNILDNKVYFVEGNSLVACFDSQINIDIINEICEVKPLKVVFRESSFRNDSEKINAYERIKKLSPETEVNVL